MVSYLQSEQRLSAWCLLCPEIAKSLHQWSSCTSPPGASYRTIFKLIFTCIWSLIIAPLAYYSSDYNYLHVIQPTEWSPHQYSVELQLRVMRSGYLCTVRICCTNIGLVCCFWHYSSEYLMLMRCTSTYPFRLLPKCCVWLTWVQVHGLLIVWSDKCYLVVEGELNPGLFRLVPTLFY